MGLPLTRPNQTSTPGEPLAREDALPLVALLAVRAEHVADLAAADADVARGYVGLGADVLTQPAHEGIAEPSDLVVALALGVEVGAALAAAHVHYVGNESASAPHLCCLITVGKLTSSQSIFEDLLEAEELQTIGAHTLASAPPISPNSWLFIQILDLSSSNFLTWTS